MFTFVWRNWREPFSVTVKADDLNSAFLRLAEILPKISGLSDRALDYRLDTIEGKITVYRQENELDGVSFSKKIPVTRKTR